MQNHDSLKFPHVCVVQASAGSGKTYALAKRYIKLLFSSPGKEELVLRSILAITFTNKATVEMKERILAMLKNIAFGSLSLPGMLKEESQKKALKIVNEIIAHYSFFGVQTIDSFINALLLGCALRINRSAHFVIKRDYRMQLEYCFDSLVDQSSLNSKLLEFLEEFLEHYLFVENQKGWFPRKDILLLLESLFRLCNKHGQDFIVYPGKAKELLKDKAALYEKIKELSLEFPQGLNQRAQTAILKFLENQDSYFDLNALPSWLESADVPMNKGKEASLAYEKKWRAVHKKIVSLVEEEAKRVYTPYIRFFQGMKTLFDYLGKQDDVIFLEELNSQAQQIFSKEGVTVAEVYYRLATRFRHFLVDEFQDTSMLQWKNLSVMVEEALSTGGSLFYVGDKKQAIYRFRGGCVELFDQVKEEFSHFNLCFDQLLNNWRSQKAIVEFNNLVFDAENLKKAIAGSGVGKELSLKQVESVISVFLETKQTYTEKNCYGYVNIERINEENVLDRNRIVKDKLKTLVLELSARFNYKDIAILARDNSEVELITAWLFEESIDVESEKTLNVLENIIVKELTAFLRFLYSPVDDLSFSAFILGSLFSQVTGLSREEMRSYLFSINAENKKEKSQHSLYTLFRQDYPQIWDSYIAQFFKSVGFVSTYELVISIYEKFSLLEKFSVLTAFLMKFLELIKKKEEDCVSLSEFFDYLAKPLAEDLYVNVSRHNAVKVLTMHKAKGLEFPVVIIPFLEMDISPETAGRGTNSYLVEEKDHGLGLLRITKVYRAYSKKLQDIYSQAYAKACIDELNVVYVALTRAKHELYVFIPRKSGNSNNKLTYFIPEDVRELGEKIAYPKEQEKIENSVELLETSYCDWVETLKNEQVSLTDVLFRARIQEGNILHALLSNIALVDKENITVQIHRALEIVRNQYQILEERKSYQVKLREILLNPKFKDIFMPDVAQVYCEKELVNRFGDTKRVDRLVVGKNQVLVIDYKSGRGGVDSHRQYVTQVEEYINLLTEIYPSKLVKGFLLYLNPVELEEVN